MDTKQQNNFEATGTLGRGVDHLGWLSTKLRDLRGFATLAYELIQNADDAKNTHSISFDVRDDALIVDNDGVFTSCGALEAKECLWKTRDPNSHRCDFHRFRILAGGDKRNEEGTTGAFGIGFVAVYQITDHPELISNGQHWYLDETQPEEMRIQYHASSKCPRCSGALPGTRFILTWARDPESPLRQSLKIEEISQAQIEQFLETLIETLPSALLFLKQLDAIRISRNGALIREIQRAKEGNQIVITDGNETRLWYLGYGKFADEEATLREKYKNKIEDKRKSDVVIAIPETAIDAGLLYAVLPTEFKMGFPFHISADFFPNSERKGIIFETDYQSAWNRAALRGAGVALQKMLRQLPHQIGHARFWELVDAVYSVKTKGLKNQVEVSLGEIWDAIEDDLAELPLARTTTNEWRKPRDTFYFYQSEEEESLPVLEALNISILHPEVREFVFRMPKEVGFQRFGLTHLIQALVKRGFTQRRERAELPVVLREARGLELLWQEIERLGFKIQALRDELVKCAIAPGRDGAVYPCNKIFYAKEKETIALFEKLNLGIAFLADVGEAGQILYDLCEKFTAGEAAVAVSRLSSEKIKQLAAKGRFSPSELLGWFENRRPDSLKPGVRERIAQLPIFPTGDHFAPLTQLALTGNFTDPLGLATLVDLERAGNRRDFLRELDAQELTFQRYARESIPRAFESGQSLSTEKKRAVVRLLAEQLGSIRDVREIKEALSGLPLVECQDAQFRRASQVYFLSSEIQALVRTDAHFATVPAIATEALRDLYSWLGVASSPRWNDLQTSVTLLSRSPLSEENVSYSQRLFEHLTQRAKYEAIPIVFRQTQWLPARADRSRWYGPRELHAIFQDYLYASQARFLDFPRTVQNDAAGLLPMLGIATTPTSAQVVDHLLYCAERNEPVNLEVYTYLNQKDQNAEAQRVKEREIERLQGERCLALENREYVRPDQVFWGGHSFGRFRHTLGPEMQRFATLFALLNVRKDPTYEDAKSVIFDIAAELGTSGESLDDEANAVILSCWHILDTAFDQDKIKESFFYDFEKAPTIPDANRVLRSPKQLFFEDKTGVASLFGADIQSRIIPRALGAWRAMAFAGVRSLRDAVDSELAECIEPRQDAMVAPRLARRRLQLARIIIAHEPNYKDALEFLDNLKIFVVRDLKVYWTLRSAGNLLSSQVQDVLAHLKLTDKTLYHVAAGATPPWYDLARELALALLPEVEPGTLAPGIKEVLAPDSDDEVAANLDKLGVAPLVATEIVAPDTTNVVTALGGLAAPDGQNFVPPVTPFVPASGLPDKGAEPTDDGQGDGREPKEMDTVGRGVENPPSSGGTGAGKVDGKPSTKSRKVGPQSRLRTYVEPPNSPPSDKQLKPETIQKRTEVAQAGVEFVLVYEREVGREPIEMLPNHPGYDVESRDETGELVRLIEVKSSEGGWGKMGVRLTKNEFDTGREKGELFWLYVVEFATSDEPILHRIPNPARLANEFIFDNGWMALDEDESVLSEELFQSDVFAS